MGFPAYKVDGRMNIPADAPERIYLQHDPENDGGPFADASDVTWCADRINDNDIEYVRVDLIAA